MLITFQSDKALWHGTDVEEAMKIMQGNIFQKWKCCFHIDDFKVECEDSRLV